MRKCIFALASVTTHREWRKLVDQFTNLAEVE